MKKHLITGSILSVILSFLSIHNSNAQESFTVTPEQTKQILNTYGERSVIIHPVAHKEIDYMNDDYQPSKRLAFIIQDESIDLNTFTGSFVQFSHKYFVVLEDTKNKFVKNEVLEESDPNNLAKRHEYSYYLIQRKGAEEFYYVMSDVYLSNLQQDQSNQEVLDLIHKLGYKEYSNDGNLYIKSKTSEIKVNAQLLNELKKNPSYITALDNDQTKIAILVKQTITHSKSLDTYLNTYNIKRSHTPVKTINEWRTATAKAQNLFNQIYNLNEKYEGNYSFTLLDKSNTYDVFLNNLNASKAVLGL